MNEILLDSYNNLIGSIIGLKHSVNKEKLGLQYTSSTNNVNLSEYHKKFDLLIKKYSQFAEKYGFELDNLHKELLIKTNELQKQKELELISNCSINNNEYVKDNSVNIDYNSAVSNTNTPSDQCSVSPSAPAPMKPKEEATPKPKPKNISQPKTKKVDAKSQNQIKKKLKTKKVTTKVKKPRPKAIAKVEEKAIEYKYNAKNVEWSFKGTKRSSTVIYIANLPNTIGVSAVQYFVAQVFGIYVKKVEETKLKYGYGNNKCYALVRIHRDVPLNKIIKCMNDLNERNTKEFEESKKQKYSFKKSKGKDQKNKNNTNNNGQKSWKRRVYLKFNETFRWYETEDDMYNDPYAQKRLFVRNFDILNKNFHLELTNKFLQFGNLLNDIKIKTDEYDDHYAIVTFDNLNDAIYCCNSAIELNGRILQMSYTKMRTNL